MTDLKARPPSIPEPGRNTDTATRRSILALKQWVETLAGHTRSPLDRAVTFRSMLKPEFASALKIAIGDGSGFPFMPRDPERLTNEPPPAPVGFEVVEGITTLYLTWTRPVIDGEYYAEIYRSTVDDIGTATQAGAIGVTHTGGTQYSDRNVQRDTTYYYWIRYVRAVNNQLIIGPYNSTQGTPGSLVLDTEFVIDLIRGEIDESVLAEHLASEIGQIEGIGIQVDSLVASAAASYSIKIDNDGFVVGYGLYNGGPGDSEFIIRADSFYVIDPASPGAFNPDASYSVDSLPDEFVFGYAKINGINRFVVNAKAHILDAAITNAQVKSLSFDKIIGFDINTEILNVNRDAWITNAMIGNVIQASTTFGGLPAWKIDKLGLAEFRAINIYNPATGALIFSASAGLDGAYIKNATVGTLRIGANAVFTGSYVELAKDQFGWCNPNDLPLRMTFNHGHSETVRVVVQAIVKYESYSDVYVYKSEIKVDGVVVAKTSSFIGTDILSSPVTLGPGNHVITVNTTVTEKNSGSSIFFPGMLTHVSLEAQAFKR